MIEWDIPEEEPEEKEEHQDFRIDNDKLADWAVKKIKEEAVERDRLLALINDEMTVLKEKEQKVLDGYARNTSYLTAQLWQYCMTVKTKDTKTQSTYQLLSGKLKIKRGGIDYKRNEEQLVAWAKENSPELVKIKESVDWASMKKTASVMDGKVFDTSTGLEITGVTAEQKPDTFEVEF